MKTSFIAAAIVVASFTSISAMAQGTVPATAVPTQGAPVFDPEGNQVGTVESVQGEVVTISTGTARAGLPKTAFAVREKGLTIGMTKAQLEAAISGAAAQNNAARDAALVIGAEIKSSDGVVLGKIVELTGDDVTVTLSDGARVGLKKSNFGIGADQSLALGMKAADFVKATQSADATRAGASESKADTAADPEQGQ